MREILCAIAAVVIGGVVVPSIINWLWYKIKERF